MSRDTNSIEKVQELVNKNEFMITIVETNENYGLANEAWLKILKPDGFEYDREMTWGLGGRCETTYIHVHRYRKVRAEAQARADARAEARARATKL